MIMPGTIPLDLPTVASEITQYLPDSWQPIVDTDIDGLGSTPVKIDTERPTLGARAMTRRLARSIFIGRPPTLRSAHRGVDRQRVWLGAAVRNVQRGPDAQPASPCWIGASPDYARSSVRRSHQAGQGCLTRY